MIVGDRVRIIRDQGVVRENDEGEIVAIDQQTRQPIVAFDHNGDVVKVALVDLESAEQEASHGSH